MAELVQYSIEKLLPLLDSSERQNIFTSDEVKCIVKKLRSLQYSIRTSYRNKFDFLKYIFYLQSLIKLIKERSVNVEGTKHIVYKFSLHTKNMIEKSISINPSDTKLWFTLIDFCKNEHFRECVSEIFVKMLKIHSTKPDFWVLAAKWHFEEINSHDVARKLLQRGIRHNPESQLLWTQYFKMELMYSDLIRKRKAILERKLDEDNFQTAKVSFQDCQNDSIINGQIALVVFKNAIKAVPDISLITSFLSVLKEFEPDLRNRLKPTIIKTIKNSFSNSEEAWDCIAREEDNDLDEIPKKRMYPENQICKADEIYLKALESLPTSKMWTFYIGFHLEKYRNLFDLDIESKMNKRNHIISLMNECWDKGLMTKELFIENVFLYDEKNEIKELDRLLKNGCDKWKHDCTIWYVTLWLISRRDRSYKAELRRLFSKAIKLINNAEIDNEQRNLSYHSLDIKNPTDIWEFYIKWASSEFKFMELASIIDKGCQMMSLARENFDWSIKVIAGMKPILLKKCYELKDGLNRARSIYEKYKSNQPFVKEFFEQMIEIEMMQDLCDANMIRNIYEDYLNYFGSDDHKIWLDYCRFELDKGNPVNLGKIHFRAIKKLNNKECDKFLSAYCLFQNSLKRKSPSGEVLLWLDKTKFV